MTRETERFGKKIRRERQTETERHREDASASARAGKSIECVWERVCECEKIREQSTGGYLGALLRRSRRTQVMMNVICGSAVKRQEFVCDTSARVDVHGTRRQLDAMFFMLVAAFNATDVGRHARLQPASSSSLSFAIHNHAVSNESERA